jgi:two-component system, chemotaxis family, protein-glutamate methylesterase/glutaminase
MNNKVRVLIVDDSETARSFLVNILESADKNIEIIDSVGDAQKAAPIIVKRKPDVVVLDITMPGIDGLTFLEKLMKNYPTPVIMFSAYTSDGSYATETALKLGAVDYLLKPVSSEYDEYKKISELLIDKIIKASQKQVKKLSSSITYSGVKKKLTAEKKKERDRLLLKYGEALESTKKIVLIGSSTGGTDAVSKILDKLPPKIPPVIIVQHMPPTYTRAWAGRLNTIYNFEVKEVEEGEELVRNKVYIAPGGKHIVLKATSKKIFINLSDSVPVKSCKPSIDVLFNSINREKLARRCIGVILTGMGSDGADGLLQIKELGAYTIAQDEDSSLIYGMPKAAVDKGGVCEILDIDSIPYKILELL